jgi:hypothetical protein
MLTILKFINSLLTVIDVIGGMCRDAQQRQAGRDSVIADSVVRLVAAREKANANVRNFDDAIDMCRMRLRADNRD